MIQPMYLHGAESHGWMHELLEPLEGSLPGGEATVEFLSHLVADAVKIYLILFIVMFAVFFAQTYVNTDRMKHKLAGLTSIWGYLFAMVMGVISPFCSCSIVPVLMGLIAVGVPMPVCLCVLTSASLLNLTAVTALYSLMGASYATLYLGCSVAIIAASSLILSRLHFRDSTVEYQLSHCHGHEHDLDHHDNHDQMKGRASLALHSTWHVFRGAWMWILLGVVLAAGLEAYFPLETISQMISRNTGLSILIAALIGFPIHSDVFTISPILQLLGNISLPVSLTFTLSTMVVSIPGVVLLSRVLKPKVIATYIGVLIGLTLVCGFVVGLA